MGTAEEGKGASKEWITTYDYTTEMSCYYDELGVKHCWASIGRCLGEAYCGYEDNTWKSYSELRSVKNSIPSSIVNCVVDEDNLTGAECLDFNATSVKLKLKIKDDSLKLKDIPIKTIYYEFNVSTGLSEKKEKKNKEKKISFNSKEETISLTLPLVRGEELHFGENSTTVSILSSNFNFGEGHVNNEATGWSTTRDAATGTGTGVGLSYYTVKCWEGSGNYQIYRVSFPFNTSSIPDGSIIDSVLFNFSYNAKSSGDDDGNDYIQLTGPTTVGQASLTTDDYNDFSDTTISDTYDLSSGAAGWNQLTISNTSIINDTGWTMLGVRTGFDLNNHACAAGSNTYIQIYSATSSYDPQLIITYHEADGVSPRVVLSSPADNNKTNDSTPIFNFTYFDETNASGFCVLFINGSGYASNNSVVNNTLTTFTANASLSYADDYNWSINCTDGTNINKSVGRGISITHGRLNISWNTPTANANHNQTSFINYSVKVCCQGYDCGVVNVSLDPYPDGSYKVDSSVGVASTNDFQRRVCRMSNGNVVFSWRNSSSGVENVHYGYFDTDFTWTGSKDSLGGDGAHDMSVGCDGSEAVIVYHDDTNVSAGRPWVRLNSSDSGVTWYRNNTVLANFTPGKPIYPEIIITNNSVFYTATPLANGTIVVTRFNNNSIGVNKSLGFKDNCTRIGLVGKGGGVGSDTVILFCHLTNSTIRVAKSTDSAGSFSISTPSDFNPSKCDTIADHGSASLQGSVLVYGCPGVVANNIVYYRNNNSDLSSWDFYGYNLSTGQSSERAQDLQLALDSNGNPWFVFRWLWDADWNSTIVYSHHNGTGGWEEVVNVTPISPFGAEMIDPRVQSVMRGDMLDIFYYNQSDTYYYFGYYNLSSQVATEAGVGVNESKGLVNTTVGATPFWTNNSNPRSISLVENQCLNVNWWVNATGTIGNSYLSFADTNITSNMTWNNITNKISINITNPSGSDSCTYGGSGQWNISGVDNCSLVSTNLNGNNVRISGGGVIKGLRNISNASVIRIEGGSLGRW